MSGPQPAPEFPLLFARYREPIRRYIRSLVRDAAETDDLTQETFLRAYRRLDSLEDPGKVSGWIYRIATHVCYDRFRQRSFRERPQSLDSASPGSEDQAADEPPDESAPRLDHALAQQEMSDCVQQYLEDLSDGYRAAILLHDVEGLTNPEIAEMLGCTEATVKIRLHRARNRLREKLHQGCDFTRDRRDVFICEPKPGDTKPD